jgi:hypothetical protein
MTNNNSFWSFRSILTSKDVVHTVPAIWAEVLRLAGAIKGINPHNGLNAITLVASDVKYKSLPKPWKKYVHVLRQAIELAQSSEGFLVWETTVHGVNKFQTCDTVDKVIELADSWQDNDSKNFLVIIDGRREGHGSGWEAVIEVHEKKKEESEESEESEASEA